MSVAKIKQCEGAMGVTSMAEPQMSEQVRCWSVLTVLASHGQINWEVLYLSLPVLLALALNQCTDVNPSQGPTLCLTVIGLLMARVIYSLIRLKGVKEISQSACKRNKKHYEDRFN